MYQTAHLKVFLPMSPTYCLWLCTGWQQSSWNKKICKHPSVPETGQEHRRELQTDRAPWGRDWEEQKMGQAKAGIQEKQWKSRLWRQDTPCLKTASRLQTDRFTISTTLTTETKVWTSMPQQNSWMPSIFMKYQPLLTLQKDIWPQLDDNLRCRTWSEKQELGSPLSELLQRALHGLGLQDCPTGTGLPPPVSRVDLLCSFFWFLSARLLSLFWFFEKLRNYNASKIPL